jgi:hypothetical protein
VRLGGHRPYYRFERTERPEEERTADPFRTVRPHRDDALLGVTRWTVHTVGYAFGLPPILGVRIEPLVELARAAVAPVGGGLFRPAEFYGDDAIWSFTAALRVSAGGAHRMGRYGVLEPVAIPGIHAGH